MAIFLRDGWSDKEDRQPAKCGIDRKFHEKSGTWDLGVRFPDSGLICFGSIVLRGTPEGGLLCSILNPHERLKRGY